MPSTIANQGTGTAVADIINYCWFHWTNRLKVYFDNPEIIYCYSVHDIGPGADGQRNDKVMCSVICRLSLINYSNRAQAISELKLTAVRGTACYPLRPFDSNAIRSSMFYAVPGNSEVRLTWDALIADADATEKRAGLVPGYPDLPTRFRFTYNDKWGRVYARSIEVTHEQIRRPEFQAIS